jgi:DNA-binding LytR/AlgR family response regulator
VIGETGNGFLRVLAVDDEPPALDELAYLLRADPRVGKLHTAGDATEALRVLRDADVDAVFLDIRMPGLDLGVADYVRKPVQADRIAESLRRVLAGRLVPAHPAVIGRHEREDDPTIPVELAGTTRMLPRSAVRWVEAQGDYARLHTADASHLVRVSLATLAERWADAGFVRVHRSFLVQLKLITELRMTNNGYVVVIDGHELPVSRRHTRELKDKLVRAAKQTWSK